MAKVTICFTIEQDQLEMVDGLAEKMRFNRSVMLGLLIEAGLQIVQTDTLAQNQRGVSATTLGRLMNLAEV
jgi:predicted transcriptional regulator